MAFTSQSMLGKVAGDAIREGRRFLSFFGTDGRRRAKRAYGWVVNNEKIKNYLHELVAPFD